MIHDTVPETDRRIDVKTVVYRLKGYLGQIRGKANAKTSDRIMRDLGFTPKGTNQKLRAAAKILLVEDGIPLISGTCGFWVATSVRELTEYKENLRLRAESLFRDVKAVNGILEGWEKRQGDLFA